MRQGGSEEAKVSGRGWEGVRHNNYSPPVTEVITKSCHEI